MNSFNRYILFLLILTSCNQQEKEVSISISADEIIIPNIEENSNNFKFKLSNGILFFDNIPYSGVVKEFYIDEKLKTESEYYQGKRHGFYKGYYDNGNKWFERFYLNNLKSGIHKGWYDNGSQLFEYKFNNSGVYHGEIKDWFKNGLLEKHFNFIEGKESGGQKMWDKNGKIKANFYTYKGERYGLIGLKKCISVKTVGDEKN